MNAFITGFGIGLSLILAIGAQNAFLLKQGLRQEHVFIVCVVCVLSDAALISFGVMGFGVVTAGLPWVAPVMRYAGSAFLIWYGAKSFYAALRSGAALLPGDMPAASRRKTLATALALTWLNPHVYVDTVLLIGSISTQFIGRQAAFAGGAITASALFFFSLGYGAALLRPLFAKPLSWRILEIVIGVTMWSIAARLLA